jgi:hypothetical protein
MNRKISLFKSLFETTNVGYQVTIKEVFDRIKNGTSKELVEKIRAGDKELKKKLPALMFNGIFTSRTDSGLKEHSGLCVLDFDKFENEDKLKRYKKTLKDDDFVFSVFVSPSGNGLKAIIKIPKCTASEHKLYFSAIEKHFDSEYFDEKNCNVSRVCFESYDPKIYINENSFEWTQKATEQGYSVTEKVPVLPLDNENEIITRLIKWWDENYSFNDGSRNNNLFILASAFCNYGIDEDLANGYIMNNVVIGDFKQSEVNNVVRSAYKRGEFGSKFFEDSTTIKRIKQKIQKGESIDTISKSIPSVKKESIEEVAEEFKRNASIFWNSTINKQGVEIITVNPSKYKNFLEENGFNKFYPEASDSPMFVRHQQNIVNTTSVEKIKDFVLDYLKEKNEWEVFNYVTKSTMLFNEKHLNMLDSIELKMLQDTADECFLYFQNGVVRIGKDKIDFLSYIEVDGFVWKKHIINRDYKKTKRFKNDFQHLVSKVSNDDEQRLTALENTIGYLMHSFKDKTDQKAVIFNDEEISDDANGGSGKSLMLTALDSFKKMVVINGKSFDPNSSDFVYQRVNVDTQILAFDDVKKNFNFENLFSLVTQGITVNRKNKDEIFIPFERSPKIVITTNYVINGSGGSHDRRRHEIEFNQYFNSNHKPETEYGRMLFDGWSADEWNAFDNYMINITQNFLNNGLTAPVSINAEIKRFIQQTSKDFYDWIEEGNLQKDVRQYNSEVIGGFKEEYKAFQNIDTRTFLTWLSRYSDLNGFELMKGRDHKGRYFVIETGTKEIESDDGMPF